MVIVHLDGRYFTNIADLMKITIHYDDESLFSLAWILTQNCMQDQHVLVAENILPNSALAKCFLVCCTLLDVFMKLGNSREPIADTQRETFRPVRI